MSDYRALPGVNWSRLKLLEVSPLHYQRAEYTEGSAAQQLGTYAHALLLEPETVAERFAVYDGDKGRNSNEYKAWAAERPGVTIFAPWHSNGDRVALETARAMVDAVRAHPVARVLLSQGRAEVPLRWAEDVDGHEVECKALVDWLVETPLYEQLAAVAPDEDRPLPIVVDVKTTRSIADFARDAARYGYHGQLAHYCAAVHAHTGEEPIAVILAIESSPPHDVRVFRLDPEGALAAGERHRQRLLRRLVECQQADSWPGVGSGRVEELILPHWAAGNEYEGEQ